MNDYRDWLLMFVGALICALVIIEFSSCKTIKPQVVVERHDSIMVQVKTDSIWIYQHDSIWMHQKNDTIYIERFKTLFRDRFKIDTLQVQNVVEKPVITEIEVQKRYIPKWVWWLLGLNILALVVVIGRIVYKIYFHK